VSIAPTSASSARTTDLPADCVGGLCARLQLAERKLNKHLMFKTLSHQITFPVSIMGVGALSHTTVVTPAACRRTDGVCVCDNCHCDCDAP
jgi:hypothetical protein